MNFVQYILLGIFGTAFLIYFQNKLMQTNFIKYGGHDKLVLFLTRDISDEGRLHGPRIFTFWNLSHVLYYAIGAYFFPDKALLLWTLGLIWELLENNFNAMNPMDILWNTIGVALGLALRKVQL
jgi:hypothetical protein